MYTLIDGKLVSRLLREKLKTDIETFIDSNGYAPGLAVIVVGNDPASAVYVRNKHKACCEVGIRSIQIELPEETTEKELLAKIELLNADEAIHGILVQLPLPKHINESVIINAIHPNKDVDAFHPINVGKIMLGDYQFLPCTPAGIMALLDYYEINVAGKNCVVIGRSNIVGKPMAHLLMERNGTVTVCHSKTKNIAEFTKNADIIIVAVGKAGFLTADMIREGAIVIDVGINRIDGKLCGDVDFEHVSLKTSHITPVPGGVGPMTITTLLNNTLVAAWQQHGGIS